MGDRTRPSEDDSEKFASQEDKLEFEVDFPVSFNGAGGGGGGGLLRGRGTGLLGFVPSGFVLSEDFVCAELGLATALTGLDFFNNWVSCCSCSLGVSLTTGGPESCCGFDEDLFKT